MEANRELVDYGGEKVDIETKEFAEGEVDAAEWNRMAQDVAQLCRPGPKATGLFTATTTAAPTTVTLDSYGCQWGIGASFQPVVSKTATGLYTVTWAASYVDELGNTEVLALVNAKAWTYCQDSGKTTDAFVYAITANTIQIAVKEDTGTWALADETATGSVAIAVGFQVF